MIFTETKLRGAFVMELEKFEDERGFFAHGWSPRGLAVHGLAAPLAESAISFNKKRGTIRGMHYLSMSSYSWDRFITWRTH